VYSGASPLTLGPDPRVPNPVMTPAQVTDRAAAIVADPFLVRAENCWYMFFEVLDRTTKRGEIAVATSDDGTTWKYRQIVLSEKFHLSYPFVFEWDGACYMVPETHQARSIRLYRAEEFPYRWRHIETLMTGERFADSTLVRHADRWWLFTETSPEMRHDTLRLYSSDDLRGPWVEHPRSPIVQSDPHGARPGGAVVQTPDGLIRFAQDCAPRYGLGVRAFRITTLTASEYREEPVADHALYAGTGQGWNAAGMHHVDAHCIAPGRWIASVDGWREATADEIFGRA
jgi:hypothetical protein